MCIWSKCVSLKVKSVYVHLKIWCHGPKIILGLLSAGIYTLFIFKTLFIYYACQTNSAVSGLLPLFLCHNDWNMSLLVIMDLYVDQLYHPVRVTLKLKEMTREGLRGSES